MKKVLFSLLALLAVSAQALAEGVTVWTTLADEPLEWLRQEAASFTSAFEVDVEIVELALGELRERALAAAPEGEAGDLFVGVPHDQVRVMVLGGVLADMSAYATRSYLQDLSQPARNAFTIDGKLMGLPLWVEGPALIINSELVTDEPNTYEDLIETAQELTTAETFGFVFDINNFYYSYTWLHSYGGYVFGRDEDGNYDTTDIGLAGPSAVEGARGLRSLRHDHSLIPAASDYDIVNDLFREGLLAMTYDGPWAVPAFRAAGISVEVRPLPPREDGSGWSGFLGVQGVLLNEFSEAKIDSVNLAKWLVRAEAQGALARGSFRIPASTSAAAASQDPAVTGFSEALAQSEPLIDVPEMGRVWRPMGRALTEITGGVNPDIEAVLEQAVEEIEAE